MQSCIDFIRAHPCIPDDTIDRLSAYVTALGVANQKTNLISRHSFADVWNRHVLDALQIIPLLPVPVTSFLDIGTGAGFPGMVLALSGVPGGLLVDSTRKKIDFLKSVSCETNVHLLWGRVEDIKNRKFQVITSRAVATLDRLIGLSLPLLEKDGCCIFLKGEKYDVEIQQAKRVWCFDVECIKSITNENGKILILKNISPRQKKV